MDGLLEVCRGGVVSLIVSPGVRSASGCGERGATAVEFALLFPLFLVICFGTISGGILFSDKLAITQGAREGARYGATVPYTPGGEQSFLQTIRAAADTADYGQLGSGAESYCVAFRTGTLDVHMKTAGTVESGPCPGTGGASNPLPSPPYVLVTVAKPAELNMLLYRYELAVSSTSVARYEGTT